MAPGDRLREWWASLTRTQKWIFGLVGFAAMALLPLNPPSFLNTPGISFGGTTHMKSASPEPNDLTPALESSMMRNTTPSRWTASLRQ